VCVDRDGLLCVRCVACAMSCVVLLVVCVLSFVMRERAPKKQMTTRVEDDPSHNFFLKIASCKIPLMQLQHMY
jgi:hypothetical protein